MKLLIQLLLLFVSLLFRQALCVHSRPVLLGTQQQQQLQQLQQLQQQKILFTLRGGAAVHKPPAFVSKKKAIEKEASNFLDSVATTVGKQLQSVYDTGFPTEISSGFIFGYCSGFALKRLGEVAAFVLGVSYMGLQLLGYYGYIDVNSGKLKNDVDRLIDLNKDGKVDLKDVHLLKDRVFGMLTYGMPSMGGFALGFQGGLQS